MEKKISLALGLIGMFLLGGYGTLELYNIKEVEMYRWAITILTTIGFLAYGLSNTQRHER